jgi:uncharacterized membrane protein YkvA (DUF1232 family)
MVRGKRLKIFHERILRLGAARISAADIEHLARALGLVSRKVNRLGPLRRSLGEVPLLLKLVSDYRSGRYRTIPWWAISAIAFSLLYLLNPFDLIPSFIPVLGKVDDLLVLTVCLTLVQHELSLYRAWSRGAEPEDTAVGRPAH